jgi:hypothetical protein
LYDSVSKYDAEILTGNLNTKSAKGKVIRKWQESIHNMRLQVEMGGY